MRPELQRLLATGSALPNKILVDVGSITRWAAEFDPQGAVQSPVWDLLAESMSLSHREFACIETMPSERPPALTPLTLEEAAKRFRALLVPSVAWVSSAEIFTSISASMSETRFGILTAEIDRFREQLYPLDQYCSAVLDLVTGRLYWQPHTNRQPTSDALVGEPYFAPLVEAAVRGDPLDPRRRPPGGRRAPRHRAELEAALREGKPLQSATVPSDVATQLATNAIRIEKRAELLSTGAEDVAARTSLSCFLTSSQTVVANRDPIVILPQRTESNGEIGNRSPVANIVVNGKVRTFLTRDELCRVELQELVRTHPDRWIVPRALDLLRLMLDLGVELPKRVFDPALAAFALNPDDLDGTIKKFATGTLTREEGAWLWDVRREAAPPASLQLLPEAAAGLVVEVENALQAANLTKLFADDIEPTLPVLARIERHGAYLTLTRQSTPDGELKRIHGILDRLEKNFESWIPALHPYKAKPFDLVSELFRRGFSIAPAFFAQHLSAKARLIRLARHPAVADLVRARSLVTVVRFLETLRGTGRLRGFLVPQAAGRFGYRASALNQIPKRFHEALGLRGLLGPPPGYSLVAADFSAFELRLVGGLSQDSLLLRAANHPDAFQYLVEQFFGTPATSRDRAAMKSYLHAINYGQGQRRFISEHADLDISTAERR